MPRAKPASASLISRYGMDESASLASVSPVPMSAATGRFDFLRSARWHQLAISGSGDAELVGLDVQIELDGAE
mgnify:FL=1